MKRIIISGEGTLIIDDKLKSRSMENIINNKRGKNWIERD